MPEIHAVLCPSIFHQYTVFSLCICKSCALQNPCPCPLLAWLLGYMKLMGQMVAAFGYQSMPLRPQCDPSAFLALLQWQARCSPQLLAQLIIATGGAKRDSFCIASADRIEPDGTTPVQQEERSCISYPFSKFKGNTLLPPAWHRECKCKANCPSLLSAAICTSLSTCISCWQPLLHSVLLLVITQNSHSMAVCSLETHVNQTSKHVT